jgi:hypothetical protein
MNSLLDTTAPAAMDPAAPPAAHAPDSPTLHGTPGPDPGAPVGLVWCCPCCRATLRTVASATRGACPACGSIIEAPAASQPASPLPPAPSTHLPVWKRRPCRASLIRAGLIVALLVGGVALVRTQPWRPILDGFSRTSDRQPPSTEDFRQKLQQFLDARDWAAKRQLVLDAPRVDRRGAAYYAGRDPDEIQASQFQPWTLPGLERAAGVTVLRAERPGRRPVVAIFRQTGGDWHLDWEMFTQTYDEAMPSFLAAPSFPLRTLRARLNRVFPTSSTQGTCAVQITDVLDPAQRLTVELPVGTPIMKSVAGGLAGTTTREATVEVSWARPEPDGPWVPQLQKLVCWGWQGLNDLPELPTPAAPAQDRFTTPAQAPFASPPPQAELVASTSP